MSSPLLVVDGVTKRYSRAGVTHEAVRDVSFTVEEGRTLAVVGESGAGKSTIARLAAGLEPPTRGRVQLAGRDPRPRSGRPSPVQMVFQQPSEALNALRSVGTSVAEPLRALSRVERAERVADLMRRTGLDPVRARERPRRFSGGQLQRLVIARALAAEPRLLICDEPTSALDVSVQAQIVNLLLALQASEGFGCILITHDLSLARIMADDVLVLRQGSTVEQRDAAAFFAAPTSDYARALLDAARGGASP